MTDKRIDSSLADDDGDAIKRITPARFAELDKSTVTLLDRQAGRRVLPGGGLERAGHRDPCRSRL